MRTYENTKIYKVVNRVDNVTFFGYTCMSLPSRLASLKKECNNPACSGAVYEHTRAVGKKHVKRAFVESCPCQSKDEVAARIATLTVQDEKADDKPTVGTRMNSCEIDKLHQELDEQRRLIKRLHEMVQLLSNTVMRLQTLQNPHRDANADAKANTTIVLDISTSWTAL